MDQGIYKNTILPLKSNLYHGTIAITTPSNDLNWFSGLEDMVDDRGRLIFTTIHSGGACRACIKAKREVSCTHMRLPKWKSARSAKVIEAILQEDQQIFLKVLFFLSDSSFLCMCCV